MAATAEQITLVVKSDTNKAQKDLKKLNKNLKDTSKEVKTQSKSIKKFNFGWKQAAVIIGGALVMAYKKAIDVASELEEVTSKFNVVFATDMEVAADAVDSLTESYAMSEIEARRNLSAVQDLLVPMGMASDKAADMSTNVVKLSADLGSFNNMPTAQVMADMQSALVGNFETMKKYGIVLNETVIKERARAEGLWDGKGVVDAATKAQVAYKLMVEGSTAAIGDMARTSDSYANTLKAINANTTNLMAKMGKEMLPAATDLATAFKIITAEGGFMGAVFETLGEVGAEVLGFLTKGFVKVAKAVQAANLLLLVAQGGQSDFNEAQREYNELIRSGNPIRTQAQKIIVKTYKAHEQALKLQNLEANIAFRNTAEGAAHFAQIQAQRAKEIQQQQELARQSAGLVQKKKDSNAGLIATEKQAAEAAKQRAEEQEKAALKAMEAEKKFREDFKQGMLNLASFTSSTLGQIGALFKQHTQNNIERLHVERDERLASLNEELQQKLEQEGLADETAVQQADARIASLQKELSDATKAEDKKRLKDQIKEAQDKKKKAQILEEFQKRKEKIEAEAKAKELALKIKAFETEQKLNIAQTMIDTPVAAMRAYKAMAGIPIVGPALGVAAAAAATALGAAKIAIIRSTPPPAAAEGGVIPGSPSGTLIQAGEGGRSEAILPLENEAAMEKIGGMGNIINVTFEVETLVATEEFPEQAAVEIDRALTRLAQDKNLRLSNFL